MISARRGISYRQAESQGQSECAAQSTPKQSVLMSHGHAEIRSGEKQANRIDGNCAAKDHEDYRYNGGQPDGREILTGLVHADQQEHERIRHEGGIFPESLDRFPSMIGKDAQRAPIANDQPGHDRREHARESGTVQPEGRSRTRQPL